MLHQHSLTSKLHPYMLEPLKYSLLLVHDIFPKQKITAVKIYNISVYSRAYEVPNSLRNRDKLRLYSSFESRQASYVRSIENANKITNEVTFCLPQILHISPGFIYLIPNAF